VRPRCESVGAIRVMPPDPRANPGAAAAGYGARLARQSSGSRSRGRTVPADCAGTAHSYRNTATAAAPSPRCRGPHARLQTTDGSYVGADNQVAQHPRSTSTFTRVLGHYVRERNVLSLPDAIRKMTSLAADSWDSMIADASSAARPPISRSSMPAACATRPRGRTRNRCRRASFMYIVNERVVLKNGQPTRATPGKVVKHQGKSAIVQ
jgi:hypothetical protein